MIKEYKKCSFCKLQYKLSSLVVYRKNDYLSLGYIYVCKICKKKINIKEYQSKSKDNYVINSLRYKNKINYKIESTKELLDLQLLNIKLKRKLKND